MKGRGLRRTGFALAGPLPLVAQHPRLAVVAEPPAAATLVGHAPAVMDQGQTSGCEGHGWAVGITTHCAAIGDPLGFVASPASIYTPARCVERATFPTGPAEPLGDNGTDSPAVIEALGSYGVRSIAAPTPDGRYSDITPENVNAEPRLDELEAADHTRLVGAYALPADQAGRIAAIRACIAAGVPVIIETFVDSAYEALGPGVVVDHCDPTDRNGGGHCQVILAYRTTAAGATECLVRNSWGIGWADEGAAWATERFVGEAWSLYAVDVRRAQ